MPELHEYPFAEIDSKEEIVVHLGRLSEPMTLPRLAELLQIPGSVILLHSMLAENEMFAREMYMTVREHYKDVPLDVDGEPTPMPELVDLGSQHPTPLMMAAYHQYRGEGQPDLWELPPRDLYLPLLPSLKSQLRMIYGKGTARDRIVDVERVEDVMIDAIRVFEHAIEKLERAIGLKFAEKIGGGESFAEVFGGVSMLRKTLELQRGHWRAEARRGKVSHEEKLGYDAGLANIETAIDNLETYLMGRFEAEFIVRERLAAEELLDMLSADQGNPSVLLAIEIAFTRPGEMQCAAADRVVALTHRACNALARSAKVDRFCIEHVVDILDVAGDKLSPQADAILRRDGGALGLEAIEQWEEAIADLRAGAGGRARSSVLRFAPMGVRAYRLGLSTVSAMLEQGVVAQVMTFLMRGRSGGNPAVERAAAVGRSFAIIVLRSLANDAVQHRAAAGELFVAGGARLSRILTTLRDIDVDVARRVAEAVPGAKKTAQEAATFWAAQGRKLNQLQVRPVPRSAAGASVRVAVSAAAFGLALWSLFDGDELRVDEYFGFASAAVSLGEHGGRLLEFVYKGAPPRMTWVAGDNPLQSFDRSVKQLASIGALLGVPANGVRFLVAYRKCNTWQMMIELAGGAGNVAVGVGQAMMGPLQVIKGVGLEAEEILAKQFVLARYGALTNAFGVALGIAVFLGQLYYDIFVDVGTWSVMMQMLDRLEGMPRARALEYHLANTREMISDFSECLTPLRPIAGHDSDDPHRDPPTYWKAAKLGYSERTIAKLFDVGMPTVATHLAPFFAGPDSEPGAA